MNFIINILAQKKWKTDFLKKFYLISIVLSKKKLYFELMVYFFPAIIHLETKL